MEGTASIDKAQEILAKNFIGPDELRKVSSSLNIPDPYKLGRKISKIPFSQKFLQGLDQSSILLLGMPVNKKRKKLTINEMRSFFGIDPSQKEPCFYNQDWYLKERFAAQTCLDFKWYLIKKKVVGKSRGKVPEKLESKLRKSEHFPSAILTAFTFFAYYFASSGEILWKHDYIWCSDRDANGDRIYTGRYKEPQGLNKNGFEVHRHLSIKQNYGLVTEIF